MWGISVFRFLGLYGRVAGFLVTVMLVQMKAFIFKEQLTQKRNEPSLKTVMCDKQTAAQCSILTARLH
jgi:hypothetical protein